jgi:hypothetical protein
VSRDSLCFLFAEVDVFVGIFKHIASEATELIQERAESSDLKSGKARQFILRMKSKAEIPEAADF